MSSFSDSKMHHNQQQRTRRKSQQSPRPLLVSRKQLGLVKYSEYKSKFQVISVIQLSLIADLLSIDVSLDSLLEKASKQALADVPRFGRRKLSSTDLIFAELIGNNRAKAVRQRRSAVIPAPEINGMEQGRYLPSLPQSVYGQKRQTPIYHAVTEVGSRVFSVKP
jgi:hypothetical protein